ncbi:phage virion morphogenesis protein [Pseudogemmobacter blasticus]|uniref:Phage virion morphogenesis protein n=1 Tax=Fuscovulum blasticum DSM 2131 TaxID=1188250 RepID=A0A2T4JDG1_FUSBL|nr:phage virion morphogenesis protein [Fuscovulum blasticum]PTE15921.1 phage virion morphogenesis protein [Fuscovulum blasticum DSM 2131]
MVGVVLEADVAVAAEALGRLTSDELAQIMYEVGALIEDQTKLRIDEEKTGPDGRTWAAWSDAYAQTRGPAHSLLVGEGNLLGSIQNISSGLNAIVGAHRVYAAPHQFGSADGRTPARPYLGLSIDNRSAIEDLVTGRLEDLLQ